MSEEPGRERPPAGARGPARIVVLASGSGSNLEALLRKLNARRSAAARVVRVVASRPGIRALERAERAGVEARVLPQGEAAGEALERALRAQLEEARADLVVLAGYVRLVPAGIVRAWSGRVVNVHPALLPAFGGPGMYGRRVHQAVLEAGVRVTGATVHFVDEEYDRGAIIAQWPVPVLEADTVERLAARVLETEHRLLPEVVSALARGEVRLEGGRCRWERPWFAGTRFEAVGTPPAPAER